MKVGDLVSYYNCDIAVVLWINEAGGSIKALLSSGEIGWLVKSGCKVV
mgnify:FL=1|jgi:hypothetical protein